jgi:palmitoyl transferase
VGTSRKPAAAVLLSACFPGIALLPLEAEAEESKSTLRGFVTGAAEGAKRITNEGRTDLYLSGAYWHLPFAYSHERRQELNAHAWGLGLGRSLVDARDNEESLYAMASSSSHFKPQYGVGYTWLARWRVSGDLRVGAGYTAFIFARSDIYRYLPLPGIVPVASLGTDRASLIAAYLPRISNGITGRGNVIYAFGKISFD